MDPPVIVWAKSKSSGLTGFLVSPLKLDMYEVVAGSVVITLPKIFMLPLISYCLISNGVTPTKGLPFLSSLEPYLVLKFV